MIFEYNVSTQKTLRRWEASKNNKAEAREGGIINFRRFFHNNKEVKV
jgi:hypothetical protein